MLGSHNLAFAERNEDKDNDPHFTPDLPCIQALHEGLKLNKLTPTRIFILNAYTDTHWLTIDLAVSQAIT